MFASRSLFALTGTAEKGVVVLNLMAKDMFLCIYSRYFLENLVDVFLETSRKEKLELCNSSAGLGHAIAS